MAKLTEAQTKKLQQASKGYIEYGIFARQPEKLLDLGLIQFDCKVGFAQYACNRYVITPAGLAYLYQDAPMVDQPHPAPEVEAIEDIIDSLPGRDYAEVLQSEDPFTDIGNDSAIPKRTVYEDGDIDYHILGIPEYAARLSGGQLRMPSSISLTPRAVKALISALEMALDDMVNTTDAEDTQELPIVKVDAEMSLSNLVDAALDPKNPEALEQLKTIDFNAMPLDALEAEIEDISALINGLYDQLFSVEKALRCAYTVDSLLRRAEEYYGL